MGIPGSGLDGINGQNFDNNFEIEPGLGIAWVVSFTDRPVW
jgi:hypothetical protein